MSTLTLCKHRCFRCRKPWSHELIDQDRCALPAKSQCPECDFRWAASHGQKPLFEVPKEEEPEPIDVGYARRVSPQLSLW